MPSQRYVSLNYTTVMEVRTHGTHREVLFTNPLKYSFWKDSFITLLYFETGLTLVTLIRKVVSCDLSRFFNYLLLTALTVKLRFLILIVKNVLFFAELVKLHILSFSINHFDISRMY